MTDDLETQGGVDVHPLIPWTTEDFADSFQRHMPTGPVWPRDPDATQRATIAALMPTYVRSWALACDLPAETLPSTCTNLLPEWEASLGLPDPCDGPDPTLERRQAHVVARLTQSNGPSVPALTAFAEALLNFPYSYLADAQGNALTDANGNLLTTVGVTGVTIAIKEFTPARFGQARFGDRFANEAWAYAWVVIAPGQTPPRGTGLECELQRLAQAHTLVGFKYRAPLGSFVLGQNVLG